MPTTRLSGRSLASQSPTVKYSTFKEGTFCLQTRTAGEVSVSDLNKAFVD